MSSITLRLLKISLALLFHPHPRLTNHLPRPQNATHPCLTNRNLLKQLLLLHPPRDLWKRLLLMWLCLYNHLPRLPNAHHPRLTNRNLLKQLLLLRRTKPHCLITQNMGKLLLLLLHTSLRCRNMDTPSRNMCSTMMSLQNHLPRPSS